ncbi:MAG: nucleotidyltransferase family protein [Thermoguttaceae bacterium]|jgi:glucose-1-phosphate thymidylyltransferase
MKAVVLARGQGTRMRRADEAAPLDPAQRAAAATGVKAMIPVGRPFLDYVLSSLADAGCRRVCLVVGPGRNPVREYYGALPAPGRLAIEFAVQQEPRGTADAVAAAEAFAGGDPFLAINSDNYYPPEALCALCAAGGPAVALFERQSLLSGGNIPPERISRFAVAQSDGRGLLVRILEKPDEATLAALPEPICVSMNCWRFGPAIFAACRAIAPSARGELELPDAVQYAIDALGERFRALQIRAPVLDLTTRGDIAAVAALLASREVRL